MEAITQLVHDATGALARIARGTLQESCVRFSLRIPMSEMMIVGATESCAPADGVTLLTFDHAEARAEWAPHRAIYRLRPDAGAVITARLPWTSRLARLPSQMPAVFDEQVRHLGSRVERLSLNSEEFDTASLSALRRGGNAFLLGEEAVCLGFCKDRVIFNAELLEKCAQAYVLASLCEMPIRPVPSYVRLIAGQRLRADQKRAAEALRNGEVMSTSSPY